VLAVKNGDSRLSNSNIAIVLRAVTIACSQHSTACFVREMCDSWCASRWGRDEILIARLGGVEWALEHYCAVVPTFSCSAERRSWVASPSFSQSVWEDKSYTPVSFKTILSATASRRVESTCNHPSYCIPLVHCRRRMLSAVHDE
jgi:hypothetical protein